MFGWCLGKSSKKNVKKKFVLKHVLHLVWSDLHISAPITIFFSHFYFLTTFFALISFFLLKKLWSRSSGTTFFQIFYHSRLRQRKVMGENKKFFAFLENEFQQRELRFSLRKVILVESRFTDFSKYLRKVILVTTRFTDFSKSLRKVILV